MKPKHYLPVLLVLFAGINAFAYDAKINGIYYNFSSSSEVEVTYQSFEGWGGMSIQMRPPTTLVILSFLHLLLTTESPIA